VATAAAAAAAAAEEDAEEEEEELLRGRQTGQSGRVQFFQCVRICLEDAQWGTERNHRM